MGDKELTRSESRGSLPGVQNLNIAMRNDRVDFGDTISVKSGYPMIEEEYK